ncbi:MAG TPA: amidase [Candidatus Bathyarchaeia archaeon]|nr:amidase [Candidatus Bathyarchaeia archaeon]
MRRRTFVQDGSTFAAGALLFPDIRLKRDPAFFPIDRTPPTDLWRLSARELNRLVIQKRASVTEVVMAHVERIKAVNPGINAVTSLLEETALKDAGQKDAFIAKNLNPGPMFGVPFSVKENVDLAGSATTEGVKFLKENVVETDSPHVGFLRRSGAVPLARTNMPDFGLRYHTANDLFGATINPWNALLTPGGSSGGDAAAVATGMVPIGLGNDYGGSIRYPAQCCGVCGLRPSRGRIPFYAKSLSSGTIPQSLKMFAVQGPLARRVDDLRTALRVMSVFDARDPDWVPAPLDCRSGRRFRVALITDPAGLGVDDSVREGVKKAGSILEKAGGIVEDTDSSSLRESAQLWIQIIGTDIQNLHLPAIRKYASLPGRQFVDELLSLQTDPTLAHYVECLARVHGIAQAWGEFFQKYDVILGPVSSRNPFVVGSDVRGRDAARTLLESQALTVSVNLLGLPSVALPVGIANGIPQAVQIISPLYQEGRSLDLAQIIENEVGVFTPIDPKARTDAADRSGKRP